MSRLIDLKQQSSNTPQKARKNEIKQRNDNGRLRCVDVAGGVFQCAFAVPDISPSLLLSECDLSYP
jgi:hypothetical protein